MLAVSILINTTFKKFITLQRGFDLPKKNRISGKFPVVASTSIQGFHAEYKVIPPGVVTGRSGSLGKVLYLDKSFWPLNTTLWVKDFKGNIPKYVYYFLQTLGLERYNSGAGVPTLNRNHLDSLEVAIADLSSQRKIASILSNYDDLIENNQRRINILQEMVQTLYREWFVKFRFPGHEKVRFIDSPMGRIPKGWEIQNATNAITVRPNMKVPKEGIKPYVPMNILSNDSMLIGDVESREGNSGSKFKNGDTLFARITPCLENGKIGFVQFLPSSEAVALGSTEFIVLRSKTLCPELVYLMARSDGFRDNAIKSMTGTSGRQRVQDACFEKFTFAHPDILTISSFIKIVRPIFRQVQIMAETNEKLRRTRDLLLPRLISGEQDVSNLDIDIPDSFRNEVLGLSKEFNCAVSTIPVGGIRDEIKTPARILSEENARQKEKEDRKTIRDGPLPIDELVTDKAMAAFRKAARGRMTMERDELIKKASKILGYNRISARLREALKSHLRAAIRRHIIGADNFGVWLETPKTGDYKRDDLIDTLHSVMRKGREYEREDVVRAVAGHLGFERLRETVEAPIRSAVNGAIRRGLLGYRGNCIWRED